MFATLFSVTLFVALAIQGALADFTIYTPALVQCTGAQITWTESISPYNLVVVSADDVCGDALVNLGNITGLSTEWTVNIAAGTPIVLALEDAEGNEAWSGTVTVAASSDSSCLTSSTPSVISSSGTTLTVAASTASPTTTYAPAGAANAGLAPASGALSIRPLTALTTVVSGLLAFIVFAL
ncbi:uncharacterized protein EDB91DRAFT_1124854 [Suillus paluster]|uniref:uncharacterized protein n=1 Tax=Suillus paluster TaxID=48578 RepID=UPI001B885C32|nr:uncharacterized protein EDB91DRAFT_1124854 [Suillus paluster]KAG1744166.1 hypothetical protein EDB91DRAFT_1124854 [Suillus paluster]